ncbi:MAG: hypothetical protein FIA99_14330 [Ruminiclostridium sp.]|nr:hypothetical protein [Ruminiclostridium sp.]
MKKQMNRRERMIAALELKEPDFIPTFELMFQLWQEFTGKEFVPLANVQGVERKKLLYQNAQLYVEIADKLDWSVLPIWEVDLELVEEIVKAYKAIAGNEFMLAGYADATASIPSGSNMMEYTYWLYEFPDEAKEKMRKNAVDNAEIGKKMIGLGAEIILMCSDYCFNNGPFLSPSMFREFVTPNLAYEIEQFRNAGAYTIKHTDGNIMPILDQLAECRPNALHSIDPMAGVDIAEVKRLVGDKVCLVGNVNCALMQTGTKEEIIDSAKYCIKHAAPGGGYVFSTSNVVFKGMPLENYLLMLGIRKKYGKYPIFVD